MVIQRLAVVTPARQSASYIRILKFVGRNNASPNFGRAIALIIFLVNSTLRERRGNGAPMGR
jgi:hypothetical protein